MKNFAIILSGCGFRDGTEITEAISVLISLTEFSANYQCFAPNIDKESTNHLNNNPGETRNLIEESARICRGDIKDLSELNSKDFDGLIFPGGFGAALNLCDWGQKGAGCSVVSDVEKSIQEFYQEQKPIAACCIAPVLLAKVLGKEEITLTIGNDKETAAEIEKTGAVHETCPVDDFVTDRAHRILTTPAYMYDSASAHEVFSGIQPMIKELVELA